MKSYLKTFMTRESFGQFAKLSAIGFINATVYFSTLNLFRTLEIPLGSRTTLSFGIATLVSYFLNRRWTFRIRRGWASGPETAKFFSINVAAWAVTLLVVKLADGYFDGLSRLEENLANFFATGLILLPKFASYRDIVFRPTLSREGRDPIGPSDTTENGSQPDAESVPAHLPQSSD